MVPETSTFGRVYCNPIQLLNSLSLLSREIVKWYLSFFSIEIIIKLWRQGTSETTIFGWVWSVCLLSVLVAGIFDQFLSVGSTDVWVFYAWSYSSSVNSIWDCHFCLDVASCAFGQQYPWRANWIVWVCLTILWNWHFKG